MQKEFQKKIVSNVYNDSYILLKIPETNGNILSVRVQTRKLGKTFARGSIAIDTWIQGSLGRKLSAGEVRHFQGQRVKLP